MILKYYRLMQVMSGNVSNAILSHKNVKDKEINQILC